MAKRRNIKWIDDPSHLCGGYYCCVTCGERVGDRRNSILGTHLSACKCQVGDSIQDHAKDALHDLRALEGADPEDAHARADDILVGLLRTLGHEGIADAFERVPKWYA